MKRQLTNILCIPVVLAGIIFPFFLSGCSREEMIKEEIQEGIPTSVDLKFAVDGGDVYTKAEQSILIENRVRNLYVLQFSSDGELMSSQLYTVGASGDVVSYFEKQEEDDGASSGIIQDFPAKSGSDCSFMAFANLNQTLRNELKNVQNIEDVNKIVYKDPSDGNIERNFFIMTALLDKIDVDDNPDTPLGIIFILKRLDAKITFNVNLDIEEALTSEPVTLTNLRFRVHNIPSNSYLVGREKVSDIVVSMDNTWDNQEKFTTMSNYANFDSTYANTDGGLFHFYLKENRPVPKKMITNQDSEGYSSLYAMREAWFEEGGQSAGTPVLGRKFIYAPDNATFVEITGHLEYTRYNKENSSNEYVDADVVYLVHLGETGQSTDMNDETKVNNYDVRRNVHYVYKVTIQGVNSMIVEVEDNIDSRPGNEGDLSISTNRKVAFDSHYGRAFFQISNQNLKEASWSAESAIWGRTAIEDDGMISSPYDYKWMLFAINSEFGASNESNSKVMVKFPGLIAYDKGTDFFDSNGSLRSREQLINEIKTDKGNAFIVDGRKYTFKQLLVQGEGDYSENYYRNKNIRDSACLRDINQLINYLKENQQLFNQDGLVNITAFCEEYTYVYDPRKDNYVYQGTPVNQITSNHVDQRRRLDLWKTYANSGSRILNIQPMTSTLVSPDGNTTYTNSYISFSQNPIYTVYNTNKASTAWGLETINETGLLNYKISSNRISGNLPNTTGNGRQNFLNFFIYGEDQDNIRYKWTDIMTTETDVDDENGLKDEYRNLIYACLSRNRDLNGNDQIDNDELLWYLASIDQLTTIFVAQDALSRDQWLYTGNGTGRHHVVSSSYRDVDYFDAEKLWLMWAEEGASRGDVRGSLNALHYENYDGNHDYDYRCVRNLGIDISNIDEQPQHYAIYSRQGDIYTIDLSGLNTMAYRTAFDDGDMLPLTDERSETDKPFHSFQVKADLEYSGPEINRRSMSWLQMRDSLNNNQNPCPDGWRVPNLREMLIIISTINGEHEAQDKVAYTLEWPAFTNIATSFSFNGVSPNYSSGDRYGFRYDYPNIRLLDEDAANGGMGNWSWNWFLRRWSYNGWSGGDHPVNFRCVRDVK